MFKSMFSSGIRSIYAVSDNPTFVSEPWSIYPAKRNSNGKLVSVFIFDKKKFEQQINSLMSGSHSSSKNPKVIISECYELIKFEIGQSAKLKHPQILTIIEPLEETKSKFLFVSEPVQNNLKTVQLNKLDALTIQKGLLQISKSLQFLHNVCQIIHFNVQPSSIYINDQGDWKLFGFRFLHNLNELSTHERDNFYIMNNSSPIPFTNLNLNFAAPELLLDSSSKLSLANDIWSLGCLIYYLYNQGEYLIECFDSDSISDFKTAFKKFESRFYQNRAGVEIKNLLKDVPSKLYPLFPQMVARYPHDRLTIDQFIDSDFFNGSIIKAMWFVDEFATKTVEEKLIFMKGMLENDPESGTDVLNQFPLSFRNSKFLPLMIDDVILQELKVIDKDKGVDSGSNSESMISIAMTITLRIGSTLSSLTFQDKVYNVLFKNNQSFWKKATSGSNSNNSTSPHKLLFNSSPKVRLAIVENMEVLRAKLSDKQLTDLVKHLAEQILIVSTQPSSDQIKVQELFLTELSAIIGKFDFPYIKNTLFPLVCQIFKTTTVLSTKLATINTFETFVDQKIIDRFIVIEQLLPLLNGLKSRDKLIVGHILKLFQKLNSSEHINLEIEAMVGQILPQCWSLTFGCNNCTVYEFQEFISVIQGIESNLVEKKLKLLPERNVHEGGFDNAKESSDFSNLVNSQKFNQGNQDQILKAPKDEVTIQPTKRSNPTSPTVSGNGFRSPSSNNSFNSPSTASNSSSITRNSGVRSGPSGTTMQPKTKTPAAKTNTKSLPKTPLTFGATTQSPKVDNDALLRTLNSSFQPNKTVNLMDSNDDDDFDDFQSSGKSPLSAQSTPAGNSGIDWNVEINKTKPMNQRTSTPTNYGNTNSQVNPPYKPMNVPMVNSPISNNSNSNYPPGFDSSMVLKPTSKH